MNLTLVQEQPTFSQVAQTALITGAVVTAADMQTINNDARFAAVRSEEFYGYYRNGETVILPVSDADGYEYARAELTYDVSVYWTGAAPGVLDGLIVAPLRSPTSAGGQLYAVEMSVDQATGAVSTSVSYLQDSALGSSPTVTTDGIALVTTYARRRR